MLTCPHCGEPIQRNTYPTNAELYERIAGRLAQYGWPDACPKRHQRVMAVRNVIKLHVDGLPKGNTTMQQPVFDAALRALDMILPTDTDAIVKECSTCADRDTEMHRPPCKDCCRCNADRWHARKDQGGAQ